MKKDSHDLLSIIGACAVGTLLGIAVGMMVAPQSGDDLRGQLASKGKDLYNKARHKKDEFEDDFEDFKDDFEETLDEGLEDFEDTFD